MTYTPKLIIGSDWTKVLFGHGELRDGQFGNYYIVHVTHEGVAKTFACSWKIFEWRMDADASLKDLAPGTAIMVRKGTDKFDAVEWKFPLAK